jgi:L-2-hydroxyglutarate oxidase LhgO
LKTGKLVVATAPDEIAKLHDLHALGAANGVAGLQFLSPGELRQKEPGINGTGALFSPETGIVDSHAFILAMQAEAESKGAIFVLKTPFRSERAVGHSFTVQAGLGSEAAELSSRVLINAAGLNAQSVASRVRRMPEQLIPKRYLSRGAYFAFNGSPPFQHLVYPVPDAEGLSVHFTLDMGGQGKFGPDHEWVEKPDFIVDPARASAIAEAVRRYYPDLEESLLTPAYAGIRPKIQGPGEAPKDFNIQGREVHGITGLVNLFGIESPGLTAALAIADTVAHMVKT